MLIDKQVINSLPTCKWCNNKYQYTNYGVNLYDYFCTNIAKIGVLGSKEYIIIFKLIIKSFFSKQ